MTTIPLIGFDPIGYAADGNVMLVTFIAPSGEKIKFSMPTPMFEALVGQGNHVLKTAIAAASGKPANEELIIELKAHSVDVMHERGSPDTLLRVKLPSPDVTSYLFGVGPELTKALAGRS